MENEGYENDDNSMDDLCFVETPFKGIMHTIFVPSDDKKEDIEVAEPRTRREKMALQIKEIAITDSGLLERSEKLPSKPITKKEKQRLANKKHMNTCLIAKEMAEILAKELAKAMEATALAEKATTAAASVKEKGTVVDLKKSWVQLKEDKKGRFSAKPSR